MFTLPPHTGSVASFFSRERIRFDRNEWAGSFGDIGTDLPLLIGMILAAGLDPASVFTMFGLLQIGTGLFYGLPMPVQPLKAMAVIVITQKLSGEILFGGGLAIGMIMLALTVTGLLSVLARLIPRCVVRGLQFGLGLSLASLALRTYVPALGEGGFILAGVGFLIMLALWGNRHLPAGLLVIGLGLVYALIFKFDAQVVADGMGFALPKVNIPTLDAVLTGALVLALPQIPLSLGNSVIATRQTIEDIFPQRAVSITKIGTTYSIVNLIVPFFSGVPACHGCGGLAGHYALGARTGGSVVIYGGMYLIVGLLFSRVSNEVLQVFPQPILGVVLLFEALVLLRFIQDQAGSKADFTLALLVALMAFGLPQGYVIGLLAGTAIYYISKRRPLLTHE